MLNVSSLLRETTCMRIIAQINSKHFTSFVCYCKNDFSSK